MPLVSIIIPCYNQGRFLQDAIESALAQTCRDLEIIVINDGSTDDTEQVARRYVADPRFRCMNQSNSGLPAARNKGIRESQGLFLIFLDSDDWLERDMVQSLSDVLKDNAGTGFVYCDVNIASAGGQPANPYTVGTSRKTLNGDIFDSLILGGFFPPHAVMIRRSVLEEIGLFDDSLGGHADYDLWLRAAAYGFPALYLDRKLVHYRLHGQNMSLNWEHMQTSRKASLAKIARLFPERMALAVNNMIEEREQMYRVQTWLNDHYMELKKWVDELQQGKDWLDAQWNGLRKAVKARDEKIQSLRERLKELGADDTVSTGA